MSQGISIHIFQFPAQRHAVRNPRHGNPLRAQQLPDKIRRRLAFYGRISRQNHFCDVFFSDSRLQLIQR